MFLLLLIIVPLLLPAELSVIEDPAPGITREKRETRNLDCQALSEAEAHAMHPGEVGAPAARGSYIDTRAIVCEERLMRDGERPRRDDAILTTLSTSSAELVAAAVAALPELGAKTWHVEAFYPEAAVAAKISFATKAALVSRGRRVSDRVPVLTAGDILVIAQLPARDAFALACRRYHELDELGADDVLLGVVLRDQRETILHAGVCAAGTWRWLR